MAEEKQGPKPGESFSEMFESFGEALGKIFNDPELKAEARSFGRTAARSARTFAGRFKDEEVKAKFHEAGKAAEDFGKGVAGYFRAQAKGASEQNEHGKNE